MKQRRGGDGAGGQRTRAFLDLPDPPFPTEHDEAAASIAVSQGGRGCGCWVCRTVVEPRARARAANEAAAAECVECDVET